MRPTCHSNPFQLWEAIESVHFFLPLGHTASGAHPCASQDVQLCKGLLKGLFLRRFPRSNALSDGDRIDAVAWLNQNIH